MKRRSRRRSYRRTRHSREMTIAHVRASEAGFFENPILFDGDGDAQSNPLGETMLMLAILGVAGYGAYYWWTHRAVTANLISGQSTTAAVPVGHTLIVNAPPGSWNLGSVSQSATVLTLNATSAASATYTATSAGSAIITATSTDGTQTATVSIVVS